MKFISPSDWKPEGVCLEDAALEAVVTNKNLLVVAGPGAGKTELLAQKACYLLQTNTCPYPRKILAISFKKDAKSNLAERVERRCGKELSKRFDSMTFDSFAKSIVDRFRLALPEEYRPSRDYEITNNEILQRIFIKHYPDAIHCKKKSELKERIHATIKKEISLPHKSQTLKNLWHDLLNDNETGKSQVTFSMISILAEYLIRTNPLILRALNATYSHVFLDEFQDTTFIQYELVRTCFLQSSVKLIAVGDSKQRIMVWAGAKTDVFEDFKDDFKSVEKELLMNHRSAPRLIQLQTSLYPLLNKGKIHIQPNGKWDMQDGEANLYYFDDCDQEAETIANEIKNLIQSNVDPREIVILVKRSLASYTCKIQDELNKLDIRSRDEGEFQELLKEDIVKLLLSVLYLANERNADKWMFLTEFSFLLDGIIDDDNDFENIGKIYDSLDMLISNCKKRLIGLSVQKDETDLLKLMNEIVDFWGYERIKTIYQQYNEEKYFRELISRTAQLLWSEFILNNDWVEAIEYFEGKNTVPIMTVHKSKGLEYEFVFFIGLEDQAFFSYDTQTNEDNCTFFVAISRAKKRIDFTFSRVRKDKNQHCIKIKKLHQVLIESGLVQVVKKL
ncbi:UvrD-helicase domain-containing protein [Anoxybacteroides rupiense]|uniref:UvrD-helicase domain-containing protein n=1 Tax=Anoxybacteroides rupiense TaxID=311460 RepID=UPI0036713858